jgi:hypothetical protein
MARVLAGREWMTRSDTINKWGCSMARLLSLCLYLYAQGLGVQVKIYKNCYTRNILTTSS